ncbi:MAG: ribonuclease D [Dehalococcoidia bacterium]
MILIDSLEGLRQLSRELAGVSRIGVDTEANSFYAYRERTCLIQISTRDEDYLVDPLAVSDLRPLRSPFADSAVTKIYHAADNDVAALKRDFNLETRSLFDTMLSARILGLPKCGLADLLRDFFQVTADKRLQRYNWGERPLDRAAIAYATMDTHYLRPLCDILGSRLSEAGRLDEANEEFTRLERSTATPRVFDPQSFWRLKGVYDLQPAQQATAREVYIWRDRKAEASNRPPFRIMPDSLLLRLSIEQPRKPRELEAVPGMSPIIARRYERELNEVIRRSSFLKPPVPPVPAEREDEVLARYEALRTWRRQVAIARGVEPDVVVSNAALSALAHAVPRTDLELQALDILGPWKLKAYGPAMLAVLQRTGKTYSSD